MPTNDTGKWLVQIGKDKSSYKTKYDVSSMSQALLYYYSLNTHNGHKKRLVKPDGSVMTREIT